MSGNQNDQKDHELITTIQEKNKAKSQKSKFNAKAMALAWDHYFPIFSTILLKENPQLSECLLEKIFAAAYSKLEDQAALGKIQATDNGAVMGISSVLDFLVEHGKMRMEELLKPRAGNEEDYRHIDNIKNNRSKGLLEFDRELYKYFDDYARKQYSAISRMDREDIYQDSMLSLVKSILDDCIKITESAIFGLTKAAKLKTYFMSITINLLNKWGKRKQTTDLDSIKELDDDPDGNWGFTEDDFDKLARAFAKLDDKCAQILDLWSREFSMREIAEIMDLPDENNARVLAFRCREKLRKIFKQLP
ncbi:MAG: sigma-70 family RNA polymerase sigma factor [Saprospiraceae bacterium]|nr:sigma-70 family RNA polymerase sigma factor [Saprospiraceae bacterium]